MYTLDTNAIIYYLDRDPAVVALLDRLFENVDATFFISAVTELELYSYPDLNDEEEAGITRLPPICLWCRWSPVLPATRDIYAVCIG